MGQKNLGNRASEHVPAEPFARWLNTRLAYHATQTAGDLRGALGRLVEECGWGEQKDAQRKLLKMRKQLRSGSRNGVKGEYPTDTFTRVMVEEALHHAGVPFSEMYPEIAAAEEVVLEPDAWCLTCDEPRSPIGGLCPFCEDQIGPSTGQRLMGERRAA